MLAESKIRPDKPQTQAYPGGFFMIHLFQTETADLDLSSPGTPPAESLPVGMSSVLMPRLARLQRQLSRKAKGSQNREKARIKVGKL